MTPQVDEHFDTYLFTYRFDGTDWGFQLPARNATEARERLKAIALARLDGKLAFSAPTLVSRIGLLIVWLRNVLRAILR